MSSLTLPIGGALGRGLVVALGDALRRMRLEQGRTLEEVARTAGCSFAHLSQFELGKKKPGLGVLIAVASALGTTCSSVLLQIAEQDAALEEEALQLAVVAKFFEEFYAVSDELVLQARTKQGDPSSWRLLGVEPSDKKVGPRRFKNGRAVAPSSRSGRQ